MTSSRIVVVVGLSAMACTGQDVPVGDYGQATGGVLSVDDDSNGAAVVGPEGATLESNGVRIIIVPGALDRDVEVTLVVDEEGHTVTVSPDLVLSIPVRVEVPWPDFAAGDTVVSSTEDGDSHEVATVARDGDGVYYETDQLSVHWLRKREVIVGCWEQGWNRRLVRRGEDCSGSAVLAPTICESAYPTLAETATVDPITEWEVTQARLLSSDTSPGRQIDIREFEDTTWHADPVPTVFGSCATDRDCEGNGYRTDGECVDGSCQFDRESVEAYVMSYEAAVALSRAFYTMQVEMPEYSILIESAIDTSGRFHSAESLHYAGRAVDVSLWNVEQDRRATPEELDENLPRLAPLLLRASFSWVWFESAKHLHASIATRDACTDPYERCSCDAPTVEADPSNLACSPTSGLDDCPPCLPQHLDCDSGRPPIEGCISNGRLGSAHFERFCCPELPAEFPCLPADPALHTSASVCDGRSAEDDTPYPYFYSCATDSPPDCSPIGESATGHCDDVEAEWQVAQYFCCSRPY